MPGIQRLTVSDLAQPPGYAHVVMATGTRLVTTAGAVPLDDEGDLVGAGDVRAQTRQTLRNLMRQLEAAGASGEDVLKTTLYVAATDRAISPPAGKRSSGRPSRQRPAPCLVSRCSALVPLD
jgi:enamine deaminase RidA (YjgF/YER057c/UK114 family)